MSEKDEDKQTHEEAEKFRELMRHFLPKFLMISSEKVEKIQLCEWDTMRKGPSENKYGILEIKNTVTEQKRQISHAKEFQINYVATSP